MSLSNPKHKLQLSTTQMIALGFLLTVVGGSLLLMLPVSSADGTYTPFVDALFTSTTSVCVTGLVVVNTFEHWSLFGQIVILFLIQCGGLGIITFTTSLMLLLHKKVTLKGCMLLQDAFNLDSLSGLVRFTHKVLIGTFTIEFIGAFFYSFTFIPDFGLAKGIWISVFTSISAFCNAGIDLIGPSSLAGYATNVNVNLTTMFLITMGGLGFIVWFDILKNIRAIRNKEMPHTAFFNRLCLHTKIVLTVSISLIIIGAVIVFAFEYNNPATIGNMSVPHKILASFFQSVTTRTAGFFTFSQKGMRDATTLFCLILMFIGGSPVGTAGGVKTTTLALIIIAAMSAVKGSEYGTAYGRRIPNRTMRKALAVVLASLCFLFTSIIILSTYTGGDLLDIVFESTSAIGTVGLTRDYTATLDLSGKVIIIICMYAGRLGPMTLPIIFSSRKSKYGLAMFPREDITVG